MHSLRKVGGFTFIKWAAASNTGCPCTSRQRSWGLVQAQAVRIHTPHALLNAVQQFTISIVKQEDGSAKWLGRSRLLPGQCVCQWQVAAHNQLEGCSGLQCTVTKLGLRLLCKFSLKNVSACNAHSLS